MKKLISILLVTVMLLAVLASCGNPNGPDDTSDSDFDTSEEENLSKKTPIDIIYPAYPNAKILRSSTNCSEIVIKGTFGDSIVELFTAEDFKVLNNSKIPGAKFETIVLTKGEHVVTIYWNKLKYEVRLLWETKTDTAPLTPNSQTGKGAVTLVQVGTERVSENDNPLNGMCYVAKLADGSAIIIDGGSDNDRCADNLFKTLKKLGISKNSSGQYMIEAWIFTHGHGDHVGTAKVFVPKYKSNVSVKYIVHNLPGSGDLVAGICDETGFDTLMKNAFPNAKRVNPHSGQKYYFGNATIDMLYTPDLIYSSTEKLSYYNDVSLIFKLSGGGASALFFGDAGEEAATAVWERYDSSVFKSDIVQVTHHGLYTGVEDATKGTGHVWDNLKKVYDAANATYAVLPMHSKYGPDQRNGRFTVMVQWCNAGYQISYFMNKNDNHGDTNITQNDYNNFVASVKNGTNTYSTLYGYDGINKIVNEKGLITYTGGNQENPMATVFTFSGGAKLSENKDLYQWLG